MLKFARIFQKNKKAGGKIEKLTASGVLL